MAFSVGDQVGRLVGGRYRVVAPLAGSGRLWQAYDEVLRRPVAVKFVAVSDTTAARTAARLQTPHVARVFDVLEEDGVGCVVTELVHGDSLATLAARAGGLTHEQAASVALACLDALAAAAAVGLHHGALTAADIICMPARRIVLTGVGLHHGPCSGGGERSPDLRGLADVLAGAIGGRPGPLRSVLRGLPAIDLFSAQEDLPAGGETLAGVRRRLTEVARAASGASTPPRRRQRAVLGAGVGVAAAAAVAGVALWPGPGAASHHTLRATTTAPTRAPQESAGRAGHVSPATPPPRGTAIGALTRYRSPEGWSLAHPAGWTLSQRDVEGQQVTDVAAPDGDTYVRVNITPSAYPTPLEDWEHYAPQFAARVDGYRLLRMRALTVAGHVAADWEFTYDVSGVPLHALDREVRVDGTTYAVLFQAPSDEWAASATQRAAVMASFEGSPS